MHIELSKLAPGVEPKQAVAWWWDLQEGGADHTFLPFKHDRRVRQVGPDEVLVHDEARPLGLAMFRERWTGRLEGLSVVFSGENTFSRFAGSYTFRKDPRGTEVALDADVHLRPGLGWTEAMARPLVERLLRKDLEGHVEEMVDALR